MRNGQGLTTDGLLGTLTGFALLAASTGAAAQTTTTETATVIGQFRDWSAYSYQEKDGKACVMLSRPTASEPGGVRRGEVYALVTHRPGEKSFHVVSLIAGYTFKEDSEVEAQIDGTTYDLYTAGETAWSRDDAKLVDAMRRGARMVVHGLSSRGTKTADTYSLSGFTAAHKAINDACGVR